MIEYHKNLSLENLPYMNEEGLVCWEEFKDIPGYEGLYQVSDLGRVKSLNYRRTKIHKILKINKNKKTRYLLLRLSKNGVTKSKDVHVLVAMSFLNHKPCGYHLVVNHKNFNREDNRVSNLEVVTMRENNNLLHIKSTSKYIGVSLEKKTGLWRAQIVIDGKSIYLGKCKIEEDAMMLYINALKSLENGEIINKKLHSFTSKYKGVSWNKYRNKWTAYAVNNGKQIYLGLFDNEEDAKTTCENYIKALENGDEIVCNKKKKSSRYKGVSWDKNSKKWVAKIFRNGKSIYLGHFTSELEAYNKYKEFKNNM